MKFRRLNMAALLVAAAAMCAGVVPAGATSMDKPLNLAALVQSSHDIVTGSVSKISQGRRGSMPYTEIEVAVDKTILGNAAGTVTFRQLGLQSAGPEDNGRLYIGNLPGMPKYTVGEQVILFLGKPGQSGFRTTVGLQQGKFTVLGGNAENAFNNRGLFNALPMSGKVHLDDKQISMLATQEGVIGAGTFVAFVERAVDENWWGTSATTPAGGNGGKSPLPNREQ